MGILTGALLCAASMRADEPIRERIEWLDVWVTQADQDAGPRVLLIGDSITRGYYAGVEKELGDRAHCARLTTSTCVADPSFDNELLLLLKRYRFAVIHINNGLHGWGYSEQQYGKGLQRAVDVIRQHGGDARLIWATTTPVRTTTDLQQMAPRTERVRERNRLAAEIMDERGIATDDLSSLVWDHAEWYSQDGVHFNGQGRAAQAVQVAASIAEHLPTSGASP